MPEITREGLYNGIAAILDEPLKQEIACLILYVADKNAERDRENKRIPPSNQALKPILIRTSISCE
ncbi:MAG: hypothetical protein QXU81_07045 [Candidatus Bathyarchaeia archaeon]